MAAEGYKVSPPPRVRRHDIIQVAYLFFESIPKNCFHRSSIKFNKLCWIPLFLVPIVCILFKILALECWFCLPLINWTMLAVQAVQLGNRKRLLAFCGAVQKRCPVGAYIRPVAGTTSGYGDEVPFLSICQIEKSLFLSVNVR